MGLGSMGELRAGGQLGLTFGFLADSCIKHIESGVDED